MIDWDEVRYFHAIAHGGSVRAAAIRLGVNHATVLRRIAQLESSLGTQLFERLPAGYRMTDAGEAILEIADRMHSSSKALETRIFGRDQAVQGLVRVTLPPPFAAYLLMADFAEFARLHPGIDLHLLSSGELVNLTNREADLAIRVVYDRGKLPLNLTGIKGPDVFGGFYMARSRVDDWTPGAATFRSITVDSPSVPEWSREGDALAGGGQFVVTDLEVQLAAVRNGVGISALPCVVGDSDPLLARVPGTSLHLYGAVWLLTQGETRKSKRVRLLVDFLSERFAHHAGLLAGRFSPAN